MLHAYLADAVVVLHAAYVAFVVLGQVAILVGGWRGWAWVRNRAFRYTHLAMIGLVVAESLLHITCPLTTLEHWLRTQAGGQAMEGSFLGRAMHDLLFIDAPEWAFTTAYTLFGALVAASLYWFPPGGAKRDAKSRAA